MTSMCVQSTLNSLIPRSAVSPSKQNYALVHGLASSDARNAPCRIWRITWSLDLWFSRPMEQIRPLSTRRLCSRLPDDGEERRRQLHHDGVALVKKHSCAFLSKVFVLLPVSFFILGVFVTCHSSFSFVLTMSKDDIVSDKSFYSSAFIPSRCVKDRSLPVAFGSTWQEAVREVAAIVFHVDSKNRLTWIQQFDRRHVDKDRPFDLPDGAYMYQALPGEHIEQVDVFETDGAFVGLRLRTNQRNTQRFGDSGERSRTISADEGFIINSLCGKFYSQICKELRVLYHPLKHATIESAPSAQVKYSSTAPELAVSSTSKAFVEQRKSLKAIVFQYDTNAKALVVPVCLSATERSCYESLQDSVSSGFGEHWIELVDGERIIAVQVEHDSHQVQRLCIRTNMRTSPWFGKITSWSKVLTTTFEELPGSTICGFQGQRDAQLDKIVTLGVVYMTGDTVDMIENPIEDLTDDSSDDLSDGNCEEERIEP